jgi:N,N'-diacetyllegionaminate synthase
MSGPDHQASLNPVDFAQMVHNIRLTETMLGTAIKTPTPTELQNKKVVERFLVASRDIKVGEIIGEGMVATKRTSEQGGLGVSELPNLLAKKAKRIILKDRVIKREDIEV